MDPLLILAILSSFILTLFFTPLWIKRAKNAGLSGKDMHKQDGKEIAEAGGVPVLLGFVFGVLVYIAIKTFHFHTEVSTIGTLSLLASVLIISFIGLLDDILGWKIGLTKKTRLFFFIFGAIPLMVTNAGDSTMMGVELGIIYPLIIIPLGIVGASSTFNLIAGYNGLETSQGILVLGGLAFVTWFTGNSWISVIALIMISSLMAFYLFNKNPAKIFPGNILTYSIGGLIAIIAILGDVEKIAVFFFIPYVIEVGLKARGRLKKESFAKINHEGNLEVPYERIYGLEHLAIRLIKRIKSSKRVYENEVVLLINSFQILVIVLGLILFL